jgi:alpha-1,2-mannosyltransferase
MDHTTAFFVQIPVIGIDSLAYGILVIVPWNIVRYNIFGGSERGPDLYGTAPWNFYVNNLVLNFNCILPLALLSLPALGVTYAIDRKRLGIVSSTSKQSSPFTVLSLRLAPLYLWFGILSLQPHKEERFMFPAYPLLCFNAAVALYLMRGWLEVAYIKVTNSPYRVSYLKNIHVSRHLFLSNHRLLNHFFSRTSHSRSSSPPRLSLFLVFWHSGIIITPR